MPVAPNWRGMKTLLFFDLEGTLINTDGCLVEAFKAACASFGLVTGHFTHADVSEESVARAMSSQMHLDLLLRSLYGHTVFAPEEFEEEFFRFYTKAKVSSPLIRGAREAILFCHGKMPLYVVSAAYHEEVQEVLEQQGLLKYFTAVFGSPPNKVQLIRTVLAKYNNEPVQSVLIGDTNSDFQVAEAVGAQFYGVGDPQIQLLAGAGHHDLSQFQTWLETKLLV